MVRLPKLLLILLCIILLLFVLFGCFSAKEQPKTKEPLKNKNLPKKVALIEDTTQVRYIGLYQPICGNTDSPLGTLYRASFQNVSTGEFANALKSSYKINPPQLQKPYAIITNLHISFINKQVANLVYSEDADFLLLVKEDGQDLKYSLTPKLAGLINREYDRPTNKAEKCVMFKGVPYFAALSTILINPSQLQEIGQIDGTSFYIKRTSNQPVAQIYSYLTTGKTPEHNLYKVYNWRE